MRKPCIECDKYFLPLNKENLCYECRQEIILELNGKRKGKDD